MYARHTDKNGQWIKLPPGYDGSAFHHDTGERRPYAEMDMKIHQAPRQSDPQFSEPAGENMDLPRYEKREVTGQREEDPEKESENLPVDRISGERETEADIEVNVTESAAEKTQKPDVSLLAGILEMLDNEDWILLFIILLLLADGCQDWDILVLLGILLAIH